MQASRNEGQVSGRKSAGNTEKMNIMRERFKLLQQEEELEDKDNKIGEDDKATVEETAAVVTTTTPEAAAQTNSRWSKLKKVVRSDTARSLTSASPRASFSTPRRTSIQTTETAETIEMEDIKLMEFWSQKNTIGLDDIVFDMDVPVEMESTLENDFVSNFPPLSVTVNRVPENVVTEQKEKIQLAMYEEQTKVLDNIKRKEVDVIWREHLARERLIALETEAKQRIEVEKEKLAQITKEKEIMLGRDFRKIREELEEGLKRQQGAVRENFGKVLVHEESISRRFQVFSRLLPQPIEIRIHLLRAVKTKLRKGSYVLMLTQFDSLGGRPLSWSQIGVNGIGSLRPGITKVFKHFGRYFDRTLRVEDSCFALCPPRPLLKPSFVFVLELFELASKHNPVDRIVGWTAVPMAYETMSLIEGKLKLPFLQGEHSPAIQHFRDMEVSMATNLNNWLCNGYMEVRHMSLDELGADESMLKSTDYDLDYFNKVMNVDSSRKSLRQMSEKFALDSTSNPLHPQEGKSSKSSHSVEQHQTILPVDKGIFRRKQHGTDKVVPYSPEDMEAGNTEGGEHENVPLLSTSRNDKNNSAGAGGGSSSSAGGLYGGMLHMLGYDVKSANNNGKHHHTSVLRKDESYNGHRSALISKWKHNAKSGAAGGAHAGSDDEKIEVRERGYNLLSDENLHKQQRGKLSGVESINTKDGRRWAAAGLEGTIVRKWQAEGSRYDTEAINEEGKPDSPLNARGKFFHEPLPTDEEWVELRDQREMEDYSMSIASDPSRRKNLIPSSSARSKVRYLSLELFGDMAPYLIGTFEFYATVFLFLFAFWIRIYVHYLAQYLYLESVGTPIFDFEMHSIIVVFKYMSESISTSAEVGVVAIGPIANIAIFLFLVLSGTLFYKLAHFLPVVISKFFAAYGLASFLDPLLTLIVDLGYHNFDCTSVSDACKANYVAKNCNCFNGDFIKLWYRMLRIEGSGITGLFIMMMIYIGTSVLSALLLYEYLVHIHRDGRILDIWRRINAPAEEFFMPHDYEISREELTSICSKAAMWKGVGGTKRKLVIENGVETDEDDPNFMGKFRRYIINEVEVNGRSSVYRQFIMDNSGMILEIFEDFRIANQRKHLFGNDFEETQQQEKAESHLIRDAPLDGVTATADAKVDDDGPRGVAIRSNNNNNNRNGGEGEELV